MDELCLGFEFNNFQILDLREQGLRQLFDLAFAFHIPDLIIYLYTDSESDSVSRIICISFRTRP